MPRDTIKLGQKMWRVLRVNKQEIEEESHTASANPQRCYDELLHYWDDHEHHVDDEEQNNAKFLFLRSLLNSIASHVSH